MIAALPFFLLSGVSLVLWLRPGGRFVLTISEMEVLMRVEGLVLIVCLLLSLGAMITVKNPFTSFASKTEGEKDYGPLGVLLGWFGIALVFGGLFAVPLGGIEAAQMYWASLVLHMIGLFRLSLKETGAEASVNVLALFAFAGLGMLTQKMPLLPSFGDYPANFYVAGLFRLKGSQVLAWAFTYFLVLGVLHLIKWRIAAYFRSAEN